MQDVSISVVIPCYNAEKTISRAFNSILNQTLLPQEIILIDDASSDETLKTINTFKNSTTINITIYSLKKNMGPSHARNLGIELSREKYIAFLDADDSWNEKKLEIQYKIFNNNPDIYLIGNDVVHVNNLDIDIKSYMFREVSKNSILFKSVFKTASTLMINKNIKIRFPEYKRYSEDYQFVLMSILSGYKAIYIDAKLTIQYKAAFGEAGLSSNMLNIEKGEIDTYYQAYKQQFISTIMLIILIFYSSIKFIRRLVIVQIRRFKSLFSTFRYNTKK